MPDAKQLELEEEIARLALRAEKARYSHFDAYGREIVSNVPIAPPVGYKKQPTMVELIRQQVASAMSNAAQEAGFETFEEAEDFEVDDDYDPSTTYEAVFDPPPAPDPAKPPTAAPPAPAPTPPSDGPGAPAPSAAPPGADAKPSKQG